MEVLVVDRPLRLVRVSADLRFVLGNLRRRLFGGQRPVPAFAAALVELCHHRVVEVVGADLFLVCLRADNVGILTVVAVERQLHPFVDVNAFLVIAGTLHAEVNVHAFFAAVLVGELVRVAMVSGLGAVKDLDAGGIYLVKHQLVRIPLCAVAVGLRLDDAVAVDGGDLEEHLAGHVLAVDGIGHVVQLIGVVDHRPEPAIVAADPGGIADLAADGKLFAVILAVRRDHPQTAQRSAAGLIGAVILSGHGFAAARDLGTDPVRGIGGTERQIALVFAVAVRLCLGNQHVVVVQNDFSFGLGIAAEMQSVRGVSGVSALRGGLDAAHRGGDPQRDIGRVSGIGDVNK